MSTEKKQEAKSLKKELQEQLEKTQKELKEAQRVIQEVAVKERELQKEIVKRDQEIKKHIQKTTYLTRQLNGLSSIFDKQYQQFSDLTVLQEVFPRNTQTNKEFIDNLVRKFNETEKDK